MNSVGCSFFVDKPTRVTPSTTSCIDHLHSNLSAERLLNYIVLSDVSDHFGILTKVSDINKSYVKNDVYYRRSKLNEKEWKQFNLELKQTLDENILSQVNSGNCKPNPFAV